jgi:hypothetical protein
VPVEPTPQAMLQKIMQRLNRAPSLFLQPGFLCDVLVMPTADGLARYYEGVRRDYAQDSHFGQHDHYYLITLEYGQLHGNPLAIERDPDPARGDQAPYLHPVIRRYRGQQLVAAHHIQDDLESKWSLEVYVAPALAFVEAQLGTSGATLSGASQRNTPVPVPLLAYV